LCDAEIKIMIYYKSNRAVKPVTGSLSYLFKGTVPGKNCKNSAGNLNLFDAVAKYYSAVPENIFKNPMVLKNCFALTLARSVLDRVSSGGIPALDNRIFSEEFYLSCADGLILLSPPVRDRELLVIYLKQIVHILKESGIIYEDDKKFISAEEGLGSERLYWRLLESFWNEVGWETIFPSSPESARSLYENREVFAELLAGSYGMVSLEDLANDFFEITEICSRNDFFMISFIDFYLLTWLKHFGIVEYGSSSNNGVVHLSITDKGCNLLNSLS